MPKTKKPRITLASLYALIQETKYSLERSLEHSLHSLVQQKDFAAFRTETNIRFDSMDRRFRSMSRLQHKMAARMVSMEYRLDEHSAILGSLQKRVDALYLLVERTAGHVARLEQEYVMITEALRRLEKRFDVLEAQRLDDRITGLEARVSNLEST